MPDFEGGVTADEVLELLAAAGRHLADADGLLAARGPGSIGSAAEEAAILIARAQAEATLAIAGQLANGVSLGGQVHAAVKEIGDAAYSLKQSVNAMKHMAGG
jgi:hypothetical protein